VHPALVHDRRRDLVSFSASAISAINKGLDEALTKFARRKLTEDYPCLILDAR
jgi:transposase-like protein